MNDSRLPQGPVTEFKAVFAPRPAMWGDVAAVKTHMIAVRAQITDILAGVKFHRTAQELIDDISPFTLSPAPEAVNELSSQFLLGATQLAYETGMVAVSKLGNMAPAVVNGELVSGAVVSRDTGNTKVLLYHIEVLCRTLRIYQMYETALAREQAEKNEAPEMKWD